MKDIPLLYERDQFSKTYDKDEDDDKEAVSFQNPDQLLNLINYQN